MCRLLCISETASEIDGPPGAAIASNIKSGRRDREEPPVARHPLQRVAPAIVETDARARDEIPDGPRHQDLLRPSRRRDSRAGMHGVGKRSWDENEIARAVAKDAVGDVNLSTPGVLDATPHAWVVLRIAERIGRGS